MDMPSFILLLAVSFLSAIMGTMIGMAMAVMVPVMVFLGLPIHTAVATGRFSMVGIGLGNVGKLSKKEKIEARYVLPFSIAGIIGTLAGASFLENISENALKNLVGIFIIAISVIILFEEKLKPKGVKHKITLKHHAISILAGLFIGSYIGVVGGGAATIVIFLLILVYGLSFHKAVANQKAVTLPISIIATLVFMYHGLIDYTLGIPLFLVNLLGGWIGAGLILKFRSEWLKWILAPVSMALAIRLMFF